VKIGIENTFVSLYTMSQPNKGHSLFDLFQIGHVPTQSETKKSVFTLEYGISPFSNNNQTFSELHGLNLNGQYVRLTIESEIKGKFIINQELLNDRTSLTITNPEEFQKSLYKKKVKVEGDIFGMYRNQINNRYSIKRDYEKIYPAMHTFWRLWVTIFPIYLLRMNNNNTRQFDWFRKLDFSSFKNPVYRSECITELFVVTVATIAILQIIMKFSYLKEKVSIMILTALILLSSYILGIGSGLILLIGLILVVLKWVF